MTSAKRRKKREKDTGCRKNRRSTTIQHGNKKKGKKQSERDFVDGPREDDVAILQTGGGVGRNALGER